MITKRTLGKAALAAFALAMTGTSAMAQDFPSKPIRMIVPFAPGGLTDTFARAMARAAEDHLPNNQPVVVINKPGAGGIIGVTEAFTAEPDGYTIAFVISSPIVTQPHYGKSVYKASDFQPIRHVYDIPCAITVHTSAEWKNVDEWLAWMKEHPGEFTYGSSSGPGGVTHLLAAKFFEAAGVDARYVPFQGSAPLNAAIMGGQVSGGSMMPTQHSGGEARPMVFVTPTKPDDPIYEDVPFASDLGIDAMASVFSGIIGHKDIPADRVAILYDAFTAAMSDPAVQELFATRKLVPSTTDNAAFAEIIMRENEFNGDMLKRLGLID